MFRPSALLSAVWRAKDIVATPSAKPVAQFEPSELAFGKLLTNNMFECEWTVDGGWGTPKLTELHPLMLSPAASSLHYATECFEGMKAYVDAEGRCRLFRPDMNAKRMQSSLARLCLPAIDEKEFVDSVAKLVLLEKDWIPRAKGYSLYIRPTCISTHAILGIAPPAAALMFCICSPVGPYYKNGFKPIRLLSSDKYSRAAKGGSGCFKVGSNYGPTILPQTEAAKKGYDQVLWLNEDVVTEVGSMNFLVLWRTRGGVLQLITAPLSEGTILPGVTRDCVLTLAREWGEVEVAEEVYTMEDLVVAHNEGRIVEAFGCGTAAIVSQVSCISHDGKDLDIPCPAEGSLAVRMFEAIQAIQYGETAHPWSVLID